MTDIQKAENLKKMGNFRLKEGKVADAIQFFTKAINFTPNDHILYSNRSGAYSILQNSEKALADAIKCIQIKPDWVKGYQRKGLAYLISGSTKKAQQAFRQGLSIDPNNNNLKQELKRIQHIDESQLNNFSNDSQSYSIFLKLAGNEETKGYLKQNNFIQNVRMVIQNPNDFLSKIRQDEKLQKALRVLGMMNQQDEYLEHIFDTEKKQYVPLYKQLQNKKNQTLKLAELHKNNGNKQYKNKQFSKAIQLYMKAIQLNPYEVLYYNNIAAAFIQNKNYEQALQQVDLALRIFEKGIENDKTKLFKIYSRKASLYNKMENYQLSIQWYEKSLELDPNNTSNKAELQNVRKKYQLKLQEQQQKLKEKQIQQLKKLEEGIKNVQLNKESENAIVNQQKNNQEKVNQDKTNMI